MSSIGTERRFAADGRKIHGNATAWAVLAGLLGLGAAAAVWVFLRDLAAGAPAAPAAAIVVATLALAGPMAAFALRRAGRLRAEARGADAVALTLTPEGIAYAYPGAPVAAAWRDIADPERSADWIRKRDRTASLVVIAAGAPAPTGAARRALRRGHRLATLAPVAAGGATLIPLRFLSTSAETEVIDAAAGYWRRAKEGA